MAHLIASVDTFKHRF